MKCTYYEKNKARIKKRAKQWYLKNKNRPSVKKRLRESSIAWRMNNRKRANEIHYAYTRRYPWVKCYRRIVSRCLYSRHYLKHGIKCAITVRELKKLWLRDKAHLLKKPSIDRIDRNKPYTYKNCQFIELKENLSRRTFYRVKRNKKKVFA